MRVVVLGFRLAVVFHLLDHEAREGVVLRLVVPVVTPEPSVSHVDAALVGEAVDRVAERSEHVEDIVDLGSDVGRSELIGVATVGTPTGRWGPGEYPVDGILELTRGDPNAECSMAPAPPCSVAPSADQAQRRTLPEIQPAELVDGQA